MWDSKEQYPHVTPAYCRDCGGSAGPCADCPRPKLLTEAVPGMLAYLSVSTQWRFSPSGMPTGLAYGDCLPVIERQARRLSTDCGQELTVDDLMDDVQVIERATLDAMRERADAQDGG